MRPGGAVALAPVLCAARSDAYVIPNLGLRVVAHQRQLDWAARPTAATHTARHSLHADIAQVPVPAEQAAGHVAARLVPWAIEWAEAVWWRRWPRRWRLQVEQILDHTSRTERPGQGGAVLIACVVEPQQTVLPALGGLEARAIAVVQATISTLLVAGWEVEPNEVGRRHVHTARACREQHRKVTLPEHHPWWGLRRCAGHGVSAYTRAVA